MPQDGCGGRFLCVFKFFSFYAEIFCICVCEQLFSTLFILLDPLEFHKNEVDFKY